MRAVTQVAAETGIKVCSLASLVYWRLNLVSDDRAEREAGKWHARKTLEFAGALGVDTMRGIKGFAGPFGSGPPAVADYGAAYDRALEARRDLGPIGEQHCVYIGVENVWNRFSSSPVEMRDFID